MRVKELEAIYHKNERKNIYAPDWDNVGEEKDESHEIAIPHRVEAFHGDHDEGEHEDEEEEDFGEVVDLQVEETDFALRKRCIHDGASLAAGVDDGADGRARREHGVRPEDIFDIQRTVLNQVVSRHFVRSHEAVNVLLRLFRVHFAVQIENFLQSAMLCFIRLENTLELKDELARIVYTFRA